jgi:hypothetical protein
MCYLFNACNSRCDLEENGLLVMLKLRVEKKARKGTFLDCVEAGHLIRPHNLATVEKGVEPYVVSL